jgi:hypothetical protein
LTAQTLWPHARPHSPGRPAGTEVHAKHLNHTSYAPNYDACTGVCKAKPCDPHERQPPSHASSAQAVLQLLTRVSHMRAFVRAHNSTLSPTGSIGNRQAARGKSHRQPSSLACRSVARCLRYPGMLSALPSTSACTGLASWRAACCSSCCQWLMPLLCVLRTGARGQQQQQPVHESAARHPSIQAHALLQLCCSMIRV